MTSPLIALLLLPLCMLHCQGYGQDGFFERYSKMKLLTSCLGEETMARWRQQMVAASRSCRRETYFIPALLHQVPSVVHRQPPPSFLPSTFLNYQPQYQYQWATPQYQYQWPKQQHQYQVPKPQYVQRLNQKTQQYFTIPFTNKKLYLLKQQPPQHFTPIAYPLRAYQSYKPVAYQPHSVKGTSTLTPHRQYSPPQSYYHTMYHQQSSNQQGYQPQGSQQISTMYSEVAPSESDDEPQLATQEDTYRNPGLVYEQTEKYQEQQKLLAAAKKKERADSPQVSSFHQHTPFARTEGGQDARGIIQKREADPGLFFQIRGTSARFVPSSKMPHFVPSSKMPHFVPSSKVPHYQQPQSEAAWQEHQLRGLRSSVSDKISNMTCVMRAMKLINDELQPNYAFLENSLLELPISNELYEELKEGQRFCKQAAACQPRRSQLHDLPVSREFSSSLEFFRCFGKEKLRACLKADVVAMVQLLGADLGPVTGTGASSNVLQGSRLNSAMADLENLLNGGSGQFVDLILL